MCLCCCERGQTRERIFVPSRRSEPHCQLRTRRNRYARVLHSLFENISARFPDRCRKFLFGSILAKSALCNVNRNRGTTPRPRVYTHHRVMHGFQNMPQINLYVAVFKEVTHAPRYFVFMLIVDCSSTLKASLYLGSCSTIFTQHEPFLEGF